MVLMQM
jgi:hypothetical protein